MKKLFLTFLILCLTSTVGAISFRTEYTDYCADANNLGCWTFNEDVAYVNDIGVNGYVGQNENATYEVEANCKIGRCYDLEPASSAEIELTPYILDFKDVTDGTIVAWIYPEDHVAEPIVSLTDGTNSSNYVFRFDVVAGPDIRMFIKQTLTQFSAQTTNTIGSIDEWIHVAFVMGSTGNALYVNSEPVAITYSTGSSATTGFFNLSGEAPTEMRFGKEIISAGTASGDIRLDEIAIFSRVLTQAEIKDIYLNGLR